MPKKLTTQAVRRPIARLIPSACLQLIVPCVTASCLSTFQKQHHACMINRSGFPAGLPEVDHACTQARCHFSGTGLRCLGRTAVAPMPILHCSSRAACLLLEACMRRRCVPTSSEPLAPQRHARRIDPRPHRMCPERRLRLRRSCMPTSFGPGCIAFAAQAHAQGRVPLHEHARLPRTEMPRSGSPAKSVAPHVPRLTGACHVKTLHACFLQPRCNAFAVSAQGHFIAHHGVCKHRPAPTLSTRRCRLRIWLHR